MQLQSVGITTMATAIVIIFTKDKRKKIRNLVIVLIIAIIMIIAQIGAKIYMNNIYDEEKFEQFYEINKKEEDDQYYKDISISISGIKIIGAKESYVEKSINAYNIFKIKTTIFIMIHILIVLLICYILNKLIIFERKKSKVVKDEIFYGK